MTQLIAIAAGGSIGAILRFLLSSQIYNGLGRDFPYGTLVVNVVGSLLMGLLYQLFMQRYSVSPELKAALLVGLLGAFTTFSAFSIETVLLLEQGHLFKAMMNIIASVVLCIFATWAGLSIAKQF